jgi:hypothetical protein
MAIGIIPRLAYPVDEARQLAGGIGRTLFYAEITAGEIDSFLVGDRRLITGEAIQRYLAKKEEEARQRRQAQLVTQPEPASEPTLGLRDQEPAAKPEPTEQPARQKRQPRKRPEPAGAG